MACTESARAQPLMAGSRAGSGQSLVSVPTGCDPRNNQPSNQPSLLVNGPKPCSATNSPPGHFPLAQTQPNLFGNVPHTQGAHRATFRPVCYPEAQPNQGSNLSEKVAVVTKGPIHPNSFGLLDNNLFNPNTAASWQMDPSISTLWPLIPAPHPFQHDDVFSTDHPATNTLFSYPRAPSIPTL